ncbi:MAG TPA: radical SAM protein [Candidatus Hydrogenedentes bacterium]|nr:radical SAM protein [Candidatus Hydrogenedentota bacterium]HNT88120.1 radical SAM protein [Candidatus Hydrogenedentota bacterium]
MPSEYQGFEQGPIRPPSEAYSLLIRVTRNCPWNRCLFCPVYKGAAFSVRPVDHVRRDIDLVHRLVEALRASADGAGHVRHAAYVAIARGTPPEERDALRAAYHWVAVGGMRSVFLQDANSLFARTGDLVAILEHLRARFPAIERITSYARAHTAARKSDQELRDLAAAGLNRVHIGMESGADAVLAFMKKGVTQAEHVAAGRKVKAAGMELSEYIMPGLGGRPLSEVHARESADALNRINPDFIRLRTLAIPANTPLYEEYEAGRFDKCTDVETVREIRLFIASLDGVSSVVASDHILNLIGELEGRLPEDQPAMFALLDRFLAMSPEDQTVFQIGRRMGAFASLDDLEHPDRRAIAENACRQYGITPENVGGVLDAIMRQFI